MQGNRNHAEAARKRPFAGKKNAAVNRDGRVLLAGGRKILKALVTEFLRLEKRFKSVGRRRKQNSPRR